VDSFDVPKEYFEEALEVCGLTLRELEVGGVIDPDSIREYMDEENEPWIEGRILMPLTDEDLEKQL
jgi:hypothetical protein